MTEIKEGVATAGDQNGDESSYYFVFLNADVDSFPTKILPTKRTQNRDWGKKTFTSHCCGGESFPIYRPYVTSRPPCTTERRGGESEPQLVA